MKNQNSILIATVAALAFALAPVTQAIIDPPPSTPPPFLGPIITIHSASASATSTGGVLRGETGSFVLNRVRGFEYGIPVNFKVSGTAIAGVDYTTLVSPSYVGQSGYAVLSVKTLPDPRGSFNRLAYSVVVTLEPGPGYVVGQPSSAEIWIKP
jgi:hypothetical protein